MLGSRRHDCNDVRPDREGNCEGCACSILRNAERGDMFLLLLKGTAEFLALGPGASPQPTEFKFVRFNRETCCATFTFTEQGPPRTLDFIVDCRCICALSPVSD
ncbi:hypothetical protein [Cytobacillus oceanisediminis]|uniref:Spore coat protein Z n=1 Tax=Cytobacillus oceanisediminis TaxID=665099 RepID=A0A562K6D3_9BACI|nr:hypothetical protein [Cytobacillus oceanisediminis]TWH90794.1 hypothetical protein IQ19_00244 [Cytobacillus oceanisediminis]